MSSGYLQIFCMHKLPHFLHSYSVSIGCQFHCFTPEFIFYYNIWENKKFHFLHTSHIFMTYIYCTPLYILHISCREVILDKVIHFCMSPVLPLCSFWGVELELHKNVATPLICMLFSFQNMFCFSAPVVNSLNCPLQLQPPPAFICKCKLYALWLFSPLHVALHLLTLNLIFISS